MFLFAIVSACAARGPDLAQGEYLYVLRNPDRYAAIAECLQDVAEVSVYGESYAVVTTPNKLALVTWMDMHPDHACEAPLPQTELIVEVPANVLTDAVEAVSECLSPNGLLTVDGGFVTVKDNSFDATIVAAALETYAKDGEVSKDCRNVNSTPA